MRPLAAAALAVALLSSGAGAAERIRIPIGTSPSLGPADAPVTIVEFIDFQ